jgi:hypothetical protein
MPDTEIDIKKIGNDIAREFNKDRYKILTNGYKFDRMIFNLAFILICLGGFIIAWSNNFDMDYLKCGAVYDSSLRCPENLFDDACAQRMVANSTYCKNPFYKPADWKQQEYLMRGEYGNNPQQSIYRFYWEIGFILLAAFIFNHILHNKRTKWKEN